ncbi:MAG: HEAT repeat domain-containing protein [Elusimicrobiota bacterium]
MNKRRIICIFSVILFCGAYLFSQSDDLMDRATKEYLRGDYAGAIEDFERVLELDENDNAKTLLYKSIVEEGKRRAGNNQLEKAKMYFERALGLNPDDWEVKKNLEEVNDKLGGISKSQKETGAAVDVLQEKINKERQANSSYQNRINSLASEKKKSEKELQEYRKKLEESRIEIEELAKEAIKKQKYIGIFLLAGSVVFIVICVLLILTLRKVYTASTDSQYQLDELQEKFSGKMQEAEKDAAELEQKVASSINKMLEEQKSVVKQISMSAAGKTQEDIEEIKVKLENQFSSQQEKLIELLSLQARAFSVEKTEKIDLGERVITDVNPHIRARADSVELIPKTVSDSRVAEKMLRPYLTDSNNRVRGNACVAIYQYNPELSAKTLQDMVNSPDKWMRLTAAWAIGEIGAPGLIEYLRKLLDDIDPRVKDRAVMAFESMAEVKDDVASEIRKMIRKSRKEEE